jgi:hypothetical protein
MIKSINRISVLAVINTPPLFVVLDHMNSQLIGKCVCVRHDYNFIPSISLLAQENKFIFLESQEAQPPTDQDMCPLMEFEAKIKESLCFFNS